MNAQPRPVRPRRNDLLKLKHDQRVNDYRIQSCDSHTVAGDIAVPLGHGGSSVVYLADQAFPGGATLKRAVKFFVYRDDIADLTFHASSGPVSSSHFFDELLNITKFRHENLVKVIGAGTYSPDDYADMAVPFLVTDYVDGPTLRDVLGSAEMATQYFPPGDYSALDILLQLCRGVSHLHRASFFHCDIAPKNIFLQGKPNDAVVVLGDFGIGRFMDDRTKLKDKAVVLGTPAYCPPEVEGSLNQLVTLGIFKGFQPGWDVFAIAKIGLEILDRPRASSGQPERWEVALVALLRDVVDAVTPRTLEELESGLNWLQPIHRNVAQVPELMETFRGRRAELLAIDAPVTSPRIRKLFQHATVLRLKRLPQIMMGSSIFAGASHSRYEHSMGVYETMRRYIVAMLESTEFLRYFRASHVELALVSSALASVAVFPFAHVVRQMRERDPQLFKCFERSAWIARVFEFAHDGDTSLADTVLGAFPGINMHSLYQLVEGGGVHSEPALRFIAAALHGPLGAVVLDYVRRDSWHLGIARGDVIDLTDLLQHIVCHDGKVAVRTSGLTLVEHVLAQRYWLYRRVYWNQPHRAMHAMLRYALMSLHERCNTFESAFAATAMDGLDSACLECMHRCACDDGQGDVAQIVEFLGRDRARTFDQVWHFNKMAEAHVWSRIAEMSQVQLTELERLVEQQLPDVRAGKEKCVLLDIPRLQRPLGNDMEVMTPNGEIRSMTEVSGIVRGVVDDLQNEIQRVRVFVNPEWRAHWHRDGRIGIENQKDYSRCRREQDVATESGAIHRAHSPEWHLGRAVAFLKNIATIVHSVDSRHPTSGTGHREEIDPLTPLDPKQP